jgi:hypothetical protein
MGPSLRRGSWRNVHGDVTPQVSAPAALLGLGCVPRSGRPPSTRIERGYKAVTLGERPPSTRVGLLPAAHDHGRGRRRKGATRPYGMGLRPTLPPPPTTAERAATGSKPDSENGSRISARSVGVALTAAS